MKIEKSPELSLWPDSSSSINLAYLKLARWRMHCRFPTLVLLLLFSRGIEHRIRLNVQFQKISILPPSLEFPEGWGDVRKNPFRGGGMDIFWNYTISSNSALMKQRETLTNEQAHERIVMDCSCREHARKPQPEDELRKVAPGLSPSFCIFRTEQLWC